MTFGHICHTALAQEPVATVVAQRLQLRLEGNDLANAGQLDEALAKYTQALELAPQQLHHKLHSNIALLQHVRGDAAASLQAAEAAVACAPADWTTVRP